MAVVHAARGAPRQATASPLLAAMLVAVRWGFRYVTSIISGFCSPWAAAIGSAKWSDNQMLSSSGTAQSNTGATKSKSAGVQLLEAGFRSAAILRYLLINFMYDYAN